MTAAVPAAPQPPPAPCGCLYEFEHGPLCGPRPGSAARPLTAPDVVAGLPADVAESRAQLATTVIAATREDVTMRYRRERDEAREQLAEVRKLAESWAGRAPAARSIAEDLMTPPRDSVSADCGRELLACLEADGG